MAFASNRAKLLASAVPVAANHPVRFGTNGMGPPYGAPAATYFVGEMQQVGLTVNRTYISWDLVNPSNGVYDWTNPDLWYNTMIAANIQPIFQHIFTPNWAFTGVPGNWTHSNIPRADWPPFPGTDWDNFKAYHVTAATAAAIRYPKAWIELWNEWNQPGSYSRPSGNSAVAVTPANYADLHAAVQAAYKAVNPTQKVVVGGLLRVDSSTVILSGVNTVAPLKTAMVALSCTPDAVCIHPYMLGNTQFDPAIDFGPNAIGRNSYPAVGRFRKAMVAAGWGNVPTWVTETSYRASQANTQGAFNCQSEATKALWNRNEFEMNHYLDSRDAVGPGQSGVEVFVHYHLEDYPAPTANDYSGFYTGDPVGGPHTMLDSGFQVKNFISLASQRQHVPLVTQLVATGPTSAIATHPIVGTYTATGIAEGGGPAQITPAWRSSDPSNSIVSLSVNGFTGVCTPTAIGGSGTVSIVAYTYAANRRPIQSNPIVLTVDPQIPTTTVLSPASGWQVASSIGGTIQFTATVYDQHPTAPNPIVGQTGTWSSSDPTNAPIDQTGLLTAVGVSTGVVVTFTPTGFVGAAGTSTGNVVLNPVLQITNAPTTLINIGTVVLTVTDGVSPVTGCTIVISDPTKATAVGQTVSGLGTSGTFTIKAQHASYTDSSPSTVTSTGDKTGSSTYSYLDDKDAIGLANGTPISTYTDAGGIPWTQPTTTKRPLYTTGAINGHAAITLDGVDDYLRATTPVTSLNDTEFTYMALIKPTNASAPANEQLLDNRNATAGQQGGFVLGRNVTTFASDLSYYVPGPTLQQQFDGTGMTTGSWTVLIDRVSQGAQSRMLDGVVVGTSRTDPTYLNPVTNPPLATKGGNISGAAGDNFQGPVAIEGFVNRAVSDAERLQIYTRAKTYGAL